MDLETQWKWLVDNLPGIVAVVTASGDVAYGNQAFAALPPASTTAPPPAERPPTQETILAACREAHHTHRPQKFEMGAMEPAGPVVWYEGNVRLIQDEAGGVPLALATCLEVTDWKRAEVRLKRCDSLLEEAQRLAHWGNWDWDFRQSTLTWSNELYRIYGVVPAEFNPSYERYLQKLHPDDRARVHSVMMRVLTQHVPFFLDERVLRPDGSIRHLHTWGYPVFDAAGNLSRVVGVSQDITERKLIEEEVATVERFRKVIFDTVGDVLFYVGVEPGEKFRFLSINAAFTEATGLQPSQVVGHLVDDVIPEPSVGMVIDNYRRAIRGRRTIRWDEVSVYPTGTKHGEVMVTPLFGSNGECYGLVGSVHDITERVEAEAEARRTLTILNAIVEGTSDAVFMKDVEGRYLMMNSAGARWHGRPPYEIIGKTDRELLPPETAEEFIAADRKALAAGEPRTYEEGGLIGGVRRTLLSVKGPYRNADGKLIGIIGISRDITERKHFEEQIREHTARLKALTDAANAFAAARLDFNSVLKITARRVAEYFRDGCIIHLLSGDQLQVTAHHHVLRDVQDFMGAVLAQPNVFVDEASAREFLKTGNPVSVTLGEEQARARMRPGFGPFCERYPIHAWLIVPLRVAGQTTGSITVFRLRPGPPYSAEDQEFLQDLADRAALAIDNARLYSEAQRAIQLREDFMSIVSHELRTPLTPLKLQLQLLARTLGQGKGDLARASELLSTIMATSDRQTAKLTRLIEDMLDVSRIRSGHLTFIREDVALADVVSTVVDQCREQLERAGCTVDLRMDPSVHGHYDRRRLVQAIGNLLSNAIKYGAGKPIEISVSAKLGRAVIKIRDFGIGIAKHEQKKIFDPFERAVSVDHFGGLGLGLYIARQIIKGLGGRIELESEPNHGALFVVELPLGENRLNPTPAAR